MARLNFSAAFADKHSAMSWKTACLSLVFVSCAEKVSPVSSLAASVAAKPLKCNVFSDDTFRGRVAISRGKGGRYIKDCFDLSLLSVPESFFQTSGSLFLQIYPLEPSRSRGLRLGAALKMQIFDGDAHLHTSKSIDRKLALRLSKHPPSIFFELHTLQICQVAPRHKALQITVFSEEGWKNRPVRQSRFLLPPFSKDPSAPETQALRALHPFSRQEGKKWAGGSSSLSYMQRLHASLCPSPP